MTQVDRRPARVSSNPTHVETDQIGLRRLLDRLLVPPAPIDAVTT
jgi:hypothetical protein